MVSARKFRVAPQKKEAICQHAGVQVERMQGLTLSLLAKFILRTRHTGFGSLWFGGDLLRSLFKSRASAKGSLVPLRSRRVKHGRSSPCASTVAHPSWETLQAYGCVQKSVVSTQTRAL